MARTVKEFRLQDRAARAKLAARHHPYWRFVSEGCHLGYYRGARGGKWIARFRKAGGDESYTMEALGGADDRCEANEDTVLNWKQALDKATIWFDQQDNRPDAAQPAKSVQEIVAAYVAMRNARETSRAGKPTRSDADHRLGIHVLQDPHLPGIFFDQLVEGDLTAWQSRLKVQKATTKRRLTSDLKAALNRAYAEDRKWLPADLPGVIKHGLQIDIADDDTTVSSARDNQILADQQVRDVIKAARVIDEEGDLARMVILLAATGARFSQLRRMQIRDVQPDQFRLLIPNSRKGKARIADHIRVQVGSDILDALKPALANRKPTDSLLEHWHMVRVNRTEWKRDVRGPWTAAWQMTSRWKDIAAAAGVPHAVPYALRHSSIVRGIRAGLPIRLVAALHDTSVDMIERYYSRWITEGLEELAARAVVPLVSNS